MRILAIETSCDETAIAVVEKSDSKDSPYRVLSHALFSQIDFHKEYGGVFPTVAKREHEKSLVPLTVRALDQAAIASRDSDHPLQFKAPASLAVKEMETSIFEKNQTLGQQFTEKLAQTKVLGLDAIAVTVGPGLEPALWTGITLAKALAIQWQLPLVPTNHLHGHLASVLVDQPDSHVSWPAVALIASGGHTSLLRLTDWHHVETIGQTRDDAVGEAYDKTARIFGIPYPGGAELARQAATARSKGWYNPELPQFNLPAPMLDSGDLDFSFSGLKTAARYCLRDNPNLLAEQTKQAHFFAEFEAAVSTVLTKKVARAIKDYNPKSFIFTGGVSNNAYLRSTLRSVCNKEAVPWLAPEPQYSTDNAVMIGLSALAKLTNPVTPKDDHTAPVVVKDADDILAVNAVGSGLEV